jgi:subtilisin family serine protease
MNSNRNFRFGLSLSFALAAWLLLSATGRMQTSSTRALEYINGHPVAAGEILVHFSEASAAEVESVATLLDAAQSQQVGDGGWRLFRSQTQDVPSMIAQLRTRPGVLEVEPNYVLQSSATPNDPQLPSLWGLNNTTVPGADVHAVNAWNITTGSAETVVGVVDTGIDYTHPDLAANMWSAPTSFTVSIGGRLLTCPAGSHGFNAIAFAATSGDVDGGPSCDPMDDEFHGTHVSGTIGAVGNNGVGVVGVNWTTRLMGLKFLDNTGNGGVSDAINAMEFAIQAKAFFASTSACFPIAGAAVNSRILSSRRFSGLTRRTCCLSRRLVMGARTTTTPPSILRAMGMPFMACRRCIRPRRISSVSLPRM